MKEMAKSRELEKLLNPNYSGKFSDPTSKEYLKMVEGKPKKKRAKKKKQVTIGEPTVMGPLQNMAMGGATMAPIQSLSPLQSMSLPDMPAT